MDSWIDIFSERYMVAIDKPSIMLFFTPSLCVVFVSKLQACLGINGGPSMLILSWTNWRKFGERNLGVLSNKKNKK